MIRRFLPNGLLDFGTEQIPADVPADRPMPTAAVAGGFIFGSARILRDVPSDPDIYFNGEEPNLAVRLWTSGFDLFSPHATVIVHYYLRKDSSRHWNDAASRELMDLQARTLRRLRLLCDPDAFTPEEIAELGRYGLGTQRSLTEYEAFAGVSFAARSIASEARSFPFVRSVAVRDALALTDTLRPAPGTQLFVLGNEGVLFHESKGTLHRLNEAATRNWCALEAGWGWERIAADAACARGIPPAAALRSCVNLRPTGSVRIAARYLKSIRGRTTAVARAIRLSRPGLPSAGRRGAPALRRCITRGTDPSGVRPSDVARRCSGQQHAHRRADP